MRRFALLLIAAGAGVAVWSATARAADTDDADIVVRGEYLVRAAGCVACHTDVKNNGVTFAGGRAFDTPFGTFFSPNITPDEETGIGRWTDEEFVAALRYGERPDGAHYYPVFPFTSYTRMATEDMRAIKAYLFAQPPERRINTPHDLLPPFAWRWTMGVWKMLNFTPGTLAENARHDAVWNRGAYLVQALAHCGECHTPRDSMGAMQPDMFLAGTNEGPDNELVPNITPDTETGIGDWSHGDIRVLLRDGLKPNFDDVQGSMAEAIDDGLKFLTDDDLNAIAVYLKSLPPIKNKVERKSP